MIVAAAKLIRLVLGAAALSPQLQGPALENPITINVKQSAYLSPVLAPAISAEANERADQISIGLLRVPFINIRTFSTTCGIGLIGAANIQIVSTIKIEYGSLSINFNMSALYHGHF